MDPDKLLKDHIKAVIVFEERHSRVISSHNLRLEDYLPLAFEVIPRHWWTRDLPDYTKKEGKTEEE
jgi:hypothetical protein